MKGFCKGFNKMRVVLEANRITDFGNWFLLKNHFVSHEHTFGYYIVPQSIPSVIFKKVIEMGTTYIQVSGYWSYWYIFRVMIIYILDSIFNKIRKNVIPSFTLFWFFWRNCIKCISVILNHVSKRISDPNSFLVL